MGTSKPSIEAVKRVQDSSSTGTSLAGSLYAYRPISRAVPPLTDVQSPLKLCRSLCLLFEEECRLFQEVKEYGESAVDCITDLVLCIAQGAVKHTHVWLVLARGLGVLHLVERVKDCKESLGQDCYLYECALERVVESTEDGNLEALAEFRARLETCKGLKKFLTTPWGLLNSLVNRLLSNLQTVPQTSTVLLQLLDFLCRTLQGTGDGAVVYRLSHQSWTLLQALPLVLYLLCFLDKKPPSTESIPNRLLDACLKLLGKHPVVPGIGDLPLVLASPLQGIQLGKEGAKKIMFNPRGDLDKRAMADWEQSFSLHLTVGQAQETHNSLCEDLVHFVREIEEWGQTQPVPIQVCDAALELASKLLGQLSLWHCKILNLHAWRTACGTHAKLNDLREGPQSFKESDLPHVINLLCCLKGIALLFRQSWAAMLPKLQEKAQWVCKRFLSQFLKKVGEACDPGIQKLVDVLRRIGGSMMIAESKGLSYGTGPDAGTDFDSGAQGCLKSMKCLIEELIITDESLLRKQRFGGLISKSSGGLCVGAIKDCRDCLKDIYVLEVILEAHEHLQQISGLPGLCFSEIWFEAAGVVERPKNGGRPLELAGSAMVYPAGVSLDTVLSALSLYEDGSIAALHSFQVQHLYYELREDALLALDRAVDVMIQKTISEFRSRVCKDVLKCATGGDAKSSPLRSNYRHDACFEMPMLRIAGCQVNLSSVLVKRANHTFQSHLRDLLRNLLDDVDPTLLQDVGQSIQIMRLAHSSFVRHIPIAPWSDIWKVGVGDAFLKPLSQIICAGLFENFCYRSFLNEFHGLEIKTCPRKVYYARPVLSTVMQCFGLVHLQSTKKLLGAVGLEKLVGNILDWIGSHVDFEELSRLGDLLVANKDGAFGRSRISFGDLLAGMLDLVKPLHDDYITWLSFLKKLEALGNSLVFLRLLDSMEDVDNGPLLEDVEEWLGPSAAAGTPGMEAGSSRYMDRGVDKIRDQLMAQEGNTEKHQHMLTSLSVLFFWGAYVSENKAYGSIHVGDGLLWSMRLLARLLGQDTAWELTNWASALNYASTLDMLVGGKRSALDVRAFQFRIKQWLAVWDNIGLVLDHLQSAGCFPEATVNCTRDPDLVGFFGDAGGLGVSKLPQVPTRRTPPLHSRSGGFSPQLDSIYSSSAWGPRSSSEKSRAVSTEPYQRRAGTKSALLSPRYARMHSSDHERRPQSQVSNQGSTKSHKEFHLDKESRRLGYGQVAKKGR